MKLSKIMLTAGLAALIALQTSCRENEYGTVDLTMPDDETPSYEPIEAQYQYPHPCIMYSQEDFDYVKQSLADGTAPQEVQDELQALKNSQFAQLSYVAQPQNCIVRGDDKGTPIDDGTDKKVENYAYAMRDAGSAFQQALLYKLTDDEQYAAAAVKTLNAWAATCKGIYSNDANMYLAAGAQGYTFARPPRCCAAPKAGTTLTSTPSANGWLTSSQAGTPSSSRMKTPMYAPSIIGVTGTWLTCARTSQSAS